MKRHQLITLIAMIALCALASHGSPPVAGAQSTVYWVWGSSVSTYDVGTGTAVCTGSVIFSCSGQTRSGLPGQWTYGGPIMNVGQPPVDVVGFRFKLAIASPDTQTDDILLSEASGYNSIFAGTSAHYADRSSGRYFCVTDGTASAAALSLDGIDCDDWNSQWDVTYDANADMWLAVYAGHAQVTAYSFTLDEFAFISESEPPPPGPEPPPPPDPEDIFNDGGTIVPITSGLPGGVCYTCNQPTTINPFAWIAWLGCLLVNLFSCWLYVWLLGIVNSVLGVVNNFLSFAYWFALVYQVVLSWFGDTINAVLGWFGGQVTAFANGLTGLGFGLIQNLLNSPFIQAVWAAAGWLSMVWSVVQAFINQILLLIGDLFNGLIDLIELIWTLITSLQDAFSTPAYAFDDLVPSGGSLTDDGINNTKIGALLATGLMMGDVVFAEPALQVILNIVIGGIAFGIILWTIKLWHQIIPN